MESSNKDLFIEFYKNSHSVKDIDPGIWMSNYLISRLELNQEQIIWFCFLNAITYHLPTAYLLINEYPDLENVGIKRLSDWWTPDVQSRCAFQTDKLKQRKFLPESIESYKNIVGVSQTKFFDKLLDGSPEENFDILWNRLYKDIKHFGRFSMWNFAQMLKQVAGYQINPETLLLGEPGSESHTHGLCYAFGKIDWAKKVRYKDENGKSRKIVHKFTLEDKTFLEQESSVLLKELNSIEGVECDAFYLETVACAYKKLFRANQSRYVGYYLDRQAEDIIKMQNNRWDGVDWDILWDARNELLRKDMINLSTQKERYKWSIPDKISINPKSNQFKF